MAIDSAATPTEDPLLQVTNSDLLVTILVANVFEGTGFNGWKRGMEIALSAKNKLDFVDGSISRPATSSENFKLWKRCNDTVFSWILHSLSSDIAQSVLYSSSAKIAWDELENRFGQSNGAQLYGIQKKLTDSSQGNDSISSYFTKMKLIWDEIDAMGLNSGCTCECTCGAAAKREKFQQDQRVVQFLMGLNMSYKVVRGTILL
ncbi:uncharacterized protein LOC141614694 [Silene latifolia]|uniref:uncharacterized protein LOC141614694 n=1 Tax=Silene latifolia TaxID=37657 RepID=UPI003D77FC29